MGEKDGSREAPVPFNNNITGSNFNDKYNQLIAT